MPSILMLLLACAPEDSCKNPYASCTDTGNSPNGTTTSNNDTTPPTVTASVDDQVNREDIFDVKIDNRGISTGTITDDRDCQAVLPIDIYTDEEPASLKVFVGDFDPTNGWVQEDGYDGFHLNVIQNSIEVRPGINAYELEGDMQTISGGKQFTYDPYSDGLRDDLRWYFPFYVVATDSAGNASTPAEVDFTTQGYNNGCN